jgi:hypothetical protein
LAVAAVICLTFVVIAQWLLIWRLIERLLLISRIPILGPVRVPQIGSTTPPPEKVEPKKKLFSIHPE